LRDAQRNRGAFACLPLIDLVDDGNTWEEMVQIAQALEAAGVMRFNACFG
jgi:2,4-dienoyl-CoA reductase (NADPH2)